jgi:hypothetical protein
MTGYKKRPVARHAAQRNAGSTLPSYFQFPIKMNGAQ